MKVGFFTVDWNDGLPESSGYYRCHVPYEALQAVGHEVVEGRTFKATRWGWGLVSPFTRQAEVPDVLVLQRWLDAEAPHAVKWAQKRGQLVLADIDDWLFGLHHGNIAHVQMREQAGGPIALEHYAAMLKQVDGVICSTPFLAEKVAQHFNRNVTVVRNAIDLARWPRRTTRDLIDQSAPGWAGAVHWRSNDLETMKGMIGRVMDRHDVPFAHVGFDGDDGIVAQGRRLPPLHERIGVDRDQVDFTRGCKIADWPQLLHDSPIGVGLVPLSDHPFNRAKSALKGMEYAAVGIPFVAQDAPEYRWLHEEHGIGRIARRPKDWLRHLDELLTDPAARAADRGRNWRGLQALDVAVRASDWVDGITALAEGACTTTSRRVTLLPA